jgi:hypothetical protein
MDRVILDKARINKYAHQTYNTISEMKVKLLQFMFIDYNIE